jgi:hypothetical protein
MLFAVGSVPTVVGSNESSFGMPACSDMSLRAEQWVEFWRWESKMIAKKWK